MELALTFRDPVELLAEAEMKIECIPSVKLFNDSQYQKLTEKWCAAKFGIGYSTHVTPSLVAVNEERERLDIDICLRAGRRDWPFQLAEVQESGRKRWLEFKQFASGNLTSVPYEPERGRIEGPVWLADGVKKKLAKNYSGSETLNLLLYANFSASDLNYSSVVEALGEFRSAFASIWIVSDFRLCSVFSFPELGEIVGWGSVDARRPASHGNQF